MFDAPLRGSRKEFHDARQMGCSSVLILFPDDSITKRTRPVFPPRQTSLSIGWNSPISR